MLKLLPFRIKREVKRGHVINSDLTSIIPMIRFNTDLVQYAYVELSFRDTNKALQRLYTAYLCDWSIVSGG
jgi:hypothetical protein